MSFEEFDERIKELKENVEYINELADLNVNVFENITLDSMVVDLLAELIGDKYEWLGWWIWEKDFGTDENLEAFEADGETVIPTTTTKDIWNLIQKNVEAEKERK